jgi:integrase-like protein
VEIRWEGGAKLSSGLMLRPSAASRAPLPKSVTSVRRSWGASRAKVEVEPELWGWIETGIPSPLRYNWMRRYFKRAVEKIGRKELRLHDLCHFMAQVASDEGAATPLIQAAGRHRDPSMTRRYEMRKAKGEVARLVGRAFKRGKATGSSTRLIAESPRDETSPLPPGSSRAVMPLFMIGLSVGVAVPVARED